MALRTRPDGRYDITDENDELVAEAVHPDLVEESLVTSAQRVPTDAIIPTDDASQATGLGPGVPLGNTPGASEPVINAYTGQALPDSAPAPAPAPEAPKPIQPPDQAPIVGPPAPPPNPEQPYLDKASGVLGWNPANIDQAVTGLSSQQATDALKEKLTTKKVYSPPVPAKDEVKTYTVDRMSPVSDPVKAEIAAANQEYQDSLQLQTDINMLKSASMGLQYQKQKEMIDDQIKQRAKEKAEQDAQLKPKLAEIDSLADMVNNAKIDPDRFWKNKGDFGSVLAKIGIALGAGSAALTGGPNHVWEQVKAQIDNDIEAQKLEMQNAKNAFEVKDNVYARMKEIFESDHAAAEATRALMYNSLVADTNRMMADIGTGEALAQGQALVAQAKLDAATKRASAEQLEGGQIKENHKITAARAGGVSVTGPKNASERLDVIIKFGNKMGFSPTQAVEWANRAGLVGTAAFPLSAQEQHNLTQQVIARQAQLKYYGELSVRDPVTGKTIYADSPDAAKVANPALADYNLIDNNLFELKRIIDRNGGSARFMNVPTTEQERIDQARAKAIISANYPATSRARWRNAMQKHEQDLSKPMTGEIANDWINIVNEPAMLDAAREVIRTEMKGLRAGLRVEPGGAFVEEFDTAPPVKSPGQAQAVPGTPGMKIKK